MRMLFEKLIGELDEAKKAASLVTASFGFPDDRIEIKSVHFGDENRGHKGDVLHPDEYIKQIVRLHHASWIVGPIDRVIELLKLHEQLFKECEKAAEVLSRIDLESIRDRARACLRS